MPEPRNPRPDPYARRAAQDARDRRYAAAVSHLRAARQCAYRGWDDALTRERLGDARAEIDRLLAELAGGGGVPEAGPQRGGAA
jgi:hypothetical protein